MSVHFYHRFMFKCICVLLIFLLFFDYCPTPVLICNNRRITNVLVDDDNDGARTDGQPENIVAQGKCLINVGISWAVIFP